MTPHHAAPGDAARGGAARGDAAPDDAAQALVHGFLADYLEFYPTTGAGLGLHLYDGRAGDYSQASIDAFMRAIAAWQARFRDLAPSQRTGQAGHDAA
jgi:hypothetical protein